MTFIRISEKDILGGELFLGHQRGRALPVAALKFAQQVAVALDKAYGAY